MSLFDFLPKGISISQVDRATAYLEVTSKTAARSTTQAFAPPGARQWFGLYRYNLYWMRPSWGDAFSTVPEHCHFLAWKRSDGRIGALAPCMDGNVRASLSGDGDKGLRFRFDGLNGAKAPRKSVAGALAFGNDLNELASRCASLLQERLGSFETRERKPGPATLDYLGWCTWDAFYKEIDEKKVLRSLRSFEKIGCQLGFMILDDGWWDTRGRQLVRVGADRSKFPDGLSALARRAKKEFGLSLFGIWHAFLGYWNGIDPKGPLANRYPTLHTVADDLTPWKPEAGKADVDLVEADRIEAFYEELHSFLEEQGVDLVKVDGQSSLEACVRDTSPLGTYAAAYQNALQSSAAKRFGGNAVHCMSHSPDVLFHLRRSNIVRNSDDYFPKKPRDAQQRHVAENAYNGLWIGQFATPDWDMFQTHGPDSQFHAFARVISGGPVYVCDQPGKQDADLLQRISLPGGRALRFPLPPQLHSDCWFQNPLESSQPLLLRNRFGAFELLAAFNCNQNEDTPQSFQLPLKTRGPSYAVFVWNGNTLSPVLRPNAIRAELAPAKWLAAIVTPREKGVSPIGCLDKLVPFLAIEQSGWAARDTYLLETKDGGRIALHSRHRPQEAFVDGAAKAFRYDEQTGLASVRAPMGKPRRVAFRF